MFSKITIKGLMDSTYVVIAEIIKEYEHGFNSDGDFPSWGLYKIKENWKPAKFLEIRKKGFRRHSVVNKNVVLSIESLL